MKKRNEQRIEYSGKRIEDRKQLIANRCTLNASNGFTLIEVLVSASILGIIGLAILTTFASGFHVFERVQMYGGQQADIMLALEGMERDIRNASVCSLFAFKGEAQDIEFPIVVDTIVEVGDEEKVVPTIGKVSYFTESDGDQNILMRTQENFPKASNSEVQEDVMASIGSIQFSYHYYDEENLTFAWTDSWDDEEDNIPDAVKIELTFEDRGRENVLSRMVLIRAQKVADTLANEEGDEEDDGEENDV